MRSLVRPPGGGRRRGDSPIYGEPPDRAEVDTYRRKTRTELATAEAAELVRKRKAAYSNARLVGSNAVRRAGGGLNWYDRASRLIGTSRNEDTPVRFTRPRRLGNPRIR